MRVQDYKIEKSGGINKKIRTSLILGIIVLSLLNCFQIFWHIYGKHQIEVQSKENAQQEVERVLAELYDRFIPLMNITESFAQRLENREIPKEQLLFNLKYIMEQNPQLFAFGVAFEPYMYDDKEKAYAKYYVRKNQELELVHLDDIEDYLGVQDNWYHDEMANGPMWVGPYYMPEVDTTIIEYGVPFYYKDEKSGEKVPAGLVYINYSIEDVKNIMNSLDLGKNGYGFIITEQGKYVAHPIQNYVKGERTIFEIAQELNNTDLKTVGDRMITGNSGTLQYYNELNGQYSWLIYQPFKSTKWLVGVVFIKNESVSHIIQQRRQLICIALGIVLLTIMVCCYVAFISKGNEKVLWQMVFLLSSVLMITLCFIWHLALVMTPYHKHQQKIILDQAGLNKFLHDYSKMHNMPHEMPPVQIHTGVFVQSLEFESTNDVRVTGYIWQKYQDGLHDHISQGIVLPEMVEGEISEAYRIKDKNIETVGWTFNVVLRQNFDYTRYPFDYKDVWIKIRHKDFDKKVLLIPDLQAYEVITPTSRPGVEKDLVLVGWDIDSSFFSYMSTGFNTDFGIQEYFRMNEYPELLYTMILKRVFLAPFIADLFPVIAVVSILFSVLFMSTKDETKEKIFDMNISGVIGTNSGLLFSIIVSHTKVRSELAVRGIIYIEYFYLILYVLVVLVSVNSFLFSTGSNIRWLNYRDNIIPKLLFWPVLLLTMLAITLIIFY